MSCLFHSLSRFVDDDAFQIRQKVCNFLAMTETLLQDHPASYITWESGMDIPTYVSHMRATETWGGAIEVRAFCEVYRARVWVRVLADGRVIEFVPSDNQWYREAKISWNGGHYEPETT